VPLTQGFQNVAAGQSDLARVSAAVTVRVIDSRRDLFNFDIEVPKLGSKGVRGDMDASLTLHLRYPLGGQETTARVEMQIHFPMARHESGFGSEARGQGNRGGALRGLLGS
jgi:hypothetical protein